MANDIKTASNRRNAKKSTGPKSEAGKAKSALNSLKHGLSVRPIYDAATQEKIDELTKAFINVGKPNPLIHALARKAAEAQIMVMRVKEIRLRAWEEARHDCSITERGELSSLGGRSNTHFAHQDLGVLCGILKKQSPHLFEAPFETDEEREMAILNLATKKLSSLIRYERRAANRRDKALRELEQARADL